MTLPELRQSLTSRNIRCWAEGDRLRYDAPRGALTPELLQELREHKAQFLAILHAAPENETIQFSSFPISLDNWETGKLYSGLFGESFNGQSVCCQPLDGEEVTFAADDAPLPLDADGKVAGRVVYREKELRRFIENPPSAETLRMIHAAKKIFGGEYMGRIEVGKPDEA